MVLCVANVVQEATTADQLAVLSAADWLQER